MERIWFTVTEVWFQQQVWSAAASKVFRLLKHSQLVWMTRSTRMAGLHITNTVTKKPLSPSRYLIWSSAYVVQEQCGAVPSSRALQTPKCHVWREPVIQMLAARTCMKCFVMCPGSKVNFSNPFSDALWHQSVVLIPELRSGGRRRSKRRAHGCSCTQERDTYRHSGWWRLTATKIFLLLPDTKLFLFCHLLSSSHSFLSCLTWNCAYTQRNQNEGMLKPQTCICFFSRGITRMSLPCRFWHDKTSPELQHRTTDWVILESATHWHYSICWAGWPHLTNSTLLKNILVIVNLSGSSYGARHSLQ